MKIHIFKTGKEYRWNLRSRNGKIIACSGEGYKNKIHCRKIIEKIFGDNFGVVLDY